MRDEMLDTQIDTGRMLAANDPSNDKPLPGDPEGASINDAPMSAPDATEISDDDIDMFEDDPSIPTE